MLNSISEAPLGQTTYAIIGLIGMSVVTVVLQSVAFNQQFYFVLSEFSIIVAISVVASSFYIYSSPERRASLNSRLCVERRVLRGVSETPNGREGEGGEAGGTVRARSHESSKQLLRFACK